MPKFRKRPVVVEAFQWFEKMGAVGPVERISDAYGIQTLEGFMVTTEGDWIVTGVNGEHYPCKPGIFEKTYETVEDEDFDPAATLFSEDHPNADHGR